jgi:uncharacterized membrane protein (GlpM family)
MCFPRRRGCSPFSSPSWSSPSPAAGAGRCRRRARASRPCGRVACFIAAFLVLAAVAHVGQSARWVGWASALPLPGLFALAILSVMQDEDEMRSLGDTVLVGPLLVIPFNWLLSRAIAHMRVEDAGPLAEIATVVLFWAIAAALVFAVVPALARWRDKH